MLLGSHVPIIRPAQHCSIILMFLYMLTDLAWLAITVTVSIPLCYQYDILHNIWSNTTQFLLSTSIREATCFGVLDSGLKTPKHVASLTDVNNKNWVVLDRILCNTYVCHGTQNRNKSQFYGELHLRILKKCFRSWKYRLQFIA
jgi:hypothetical protein